MNVLKEQQEQQANKYADKFLEHLRSKNFFSNSKIDYIDQLNPVEDEILNLIYQDKYLSLFSQKLLTLNDREPVQWFDPDDSYICRDSLQCAKIAVSGVIKSLDQIMKQLWSSGFAIIRPPGHHADDGSQNIDDINFRGFCLFNNVAIGVKYLQKKHNLKKIIIIDWDVHHGNGQQQIFYEDSQVLTISFHKYDNSKFYPGKSGDPANIGNKNGIGFNINIAWNTEDNQQNNVGDDEYVFAYNQIVLPVIKEFRPEFIIVSAGFDSAKGDPLGANIDIIDAYFYIIEMNKSQCDKQLLVLEGGYDIINLQNNVEKSILTLMGEFSVKQKFEENSLKPNDIAINSVLTCINQLKGHWKCFM